MTKEQAIKKIKDLNETSFNKAQKEISINIIKNLKDESIIQDVFNLVTKRVKTGFVFDEAPEESTSQISYLDQDLKKCININENDYETNSLIIGENYDALKNLILLEGERERERVNTR